MENLNILYAKFATAFLFFYKINKLNIMPRMLFLCLALQAFFNPVFHEEFSLPIQGIDCLYMINLDERPEKWAASLKALQPWGIVPCRFSAVNGWKIPGSELNQLGVRFEKGMQGGLWGTYFDPEPHDEWIFRVGQYYFCHHITRGTIGIVLSHLSLLQDAIERDYRTIWIMEDDIEVHEDPKIMESIVEELDALTQGQWDILFTDPDTKDKEGRYVPCYSTTKRPNFPPTEGKIIYKKAPISSNLCAIGARFGAYSYIIKRSGIEKILDFYNRYAIFHPYDIDIFMIPGLRVFTTRRDIVSTIPTAISDNAEPNFEKEAG